VADCNKIIGASLWSNYTCCGHSPCWDRGPNCGKGFGVLENKINKWRAGIRGCPKALLSNHGAFSKKKERGVMPPTAPFPPCWKVSSLISIFW